MLCDAEILSSASMLAIFLPVNETQKCLLAANTVLFLHFFEEFGWPGGFPLMGIKVLMGSDEMDKTKWDCNNLSSMFGNWGLGRKDGYTLPDQSAFGTGYLK